MVKTSGKHQVRIQGQIFWLCLFSVLFIEGGVSTLTGFSYRAQGLSSRTWILLMLTILVFAGITWAWTLLMRNSIVVAPNLAVNSVHPSDPLGYVEQSAATDSESGH